MLTKLVKIDDSETIILHGASTKAYEEKRLDIFNYENKKYIFIH